MAHNVEKWRKILSDFQDAFAENDGALYPAYAVTFAERGSSFVPGKKWAQKGRLLGNVPLDGDGNGYAILGLRPGDGSSPLSEWERELIASGIPLDSRSEAGFKRFLELAAMAGAALPRCIRDAIPVAPAGAVSLWLATMWWSKPPDPSELSEGGFRVIWCSPCEDSIETIERCNLATENPSLCRIESNAEKLALVELSVDLPSRCATLRTAKGDESFDLPSEGVARWLKVLAEHPRKWIRPDDYKSHDAELDGVKPSDRFRSLTESRKCKRLAKLIETSNHDGMRFDPARV